MNKTLCLIAAGLLLLASGCTDQRFKKLKGGLEYKILKGSGDKDIKYGNTIQFRVQQYYNDSLMATPYDSVAQIMEVDSTKLPPEYVKSPLIQWLSSINCHHSPKNISFLVTGLKLWM